MAKNEVKPDFKLLLIGGSAGSMEVLLALLPRIKTLPNYAIAIILHRKNSEENTLEELFRIKASVPVEDVEDKTQLTAGKMFIAPSGYHLLFEKNGELSIDSSEKINYSRPSIDVAFESAADVFGANTTAILLSGANADGAIGMKSVKNAGGTIAIQDPNTAEMPFMPQSVINLVSPDFTLKITEMLEFINNLT